jgi:hypothetical protein
MSRGPGHVERAIAEAFARYPFKALGKRLAPKAPASVVDAGPDTSTGKSGIGHNASGGWQCIKRQKA